jgi:hypothetical protein
LKPELPPGLDILQVSMVGLHLPALQAQVRFADYAVRVSAPDESELGQRIIALMELKSLPWQHQRDTASRAMTCAPSSPR